MPASVLVPEPKPLPKTSAVADKLSHVLANTDIVYIYIYIHIHTYCA